MAEPDPDFAALLSDDLLLEVAVASDAASMARRLSRTAAVCQVARAIGSDAGRIAELCRFVEELLEEPHDPSYRHPKDYAICAALSILGAIPLVPVRVLVQRLSQDDRWSMACIRRFAQECDRLFAQGYSAHSAGENRRAIAQRPVRVDEIASYSVDSTDIARPWRSLVVDAAAGVWPDADDAIVIFDTCSVPLTGPSTVALGRSFGSLARYGSSGRELN